MKRVSDGLEKAARAVRERNEREKGVTPLSVLEREIALVSERIDRVRAHHSDLCLEVLRTECYIGSDLMALESYDPRVYVWRHRARDALKGRLLALGVERRRLAAMHLDDIAALHDRLFQLLAQRAYLGAENRWM